MSTKNFAIENQPKMRDIVSDLRTEFHANLMKFGDFGEIFFSENYDHPCNKN